MDNEPIPARTPDLALVTQPRPQRVLVLNLGRRGGVTEYGWLMARALSRHAQVAAITSTYAENSAKWAGLDVPRLSVPTFSGPLSMALSFLDVPRFARIARFARRFRPDVVYYPGGHAWKPLLDAILPGSTVTVLTVHDAILHPGEDSWPLRILSWAGRRRATGYVLLTEADRAPFVARYRLDPDRVVVLPHGIFDDYPQSAEPVADLLSGHHIPPEWQGRYVLFVGRIRAYKGIDTLLEAYEHIDPAVAGPLVLAGSGELGDDERRRLAALAGRPVVFVNEWLSDADMAGLVAAARFVVLPYRSATQSGVVPLAAALGIPPIAAATGGLVEQVEDGRTGLLVPPGDAIALRDVLTRAYAMDDAEHAALSRRTREHALSAWSWDVLAGRLAEFFATLRR